MQVQTQDDTRWIIELVSSNPIVAGVVGVLVAGYVIDKLDEILKPLSVNDEQDDNELVRDLIQTLVTTELHTQELRSEVMRLNAQLYALQQEMLLDDGEDVA
jgi:hypothetical protein